MCLLEDKRNAEANWSYMTDTAKYSVNSIHFYFSHDKTNGCHIAITPPPPPHLTTKNWKKKGMKIKDYTWHPFPSKQMNRTDDSPSLSCLPLTTRSRKKERLYSNDIPYLNSSPSLSTKYEPFSSFFNFEVAARIDLGYLPSVARDVW